MEPNYKTPSVDDLNTVFTTVSRIEREARFDHSARIVFLRNITIEGLDTIPQVPPLPERHWGRDRVRRLRDNDARCPRTTMALCKQPDPDLVVLSLAVGELDPAYGTPAAVAGMRRWRKLRHLFELLETRNAC